MNPSNTLDEFIDKLQTEGVETGLKEAEQIRTAADAEAAALIEDAREAGRQLVAQAQERARIMVADAKSELSLMVRDVRLELRAALERVLTSLLEEGLREPLGDPDVLAELLAEVVKAYAQGDAGGLTVDIEVRPELVERLTAAIPGLLGRALADEAHVAVKGGLRDAGFEYRIRDAVVEVTPASVSEKLGEMMSPQLRSLLRSVADKPTGKRR